MEKRLKLRVASFWNRSPGKNSRETGEASEKKAEQFLKKQGMKVIARNYSCKHGEIDLIMEDKDSLVFVEVRFRRCDDYGGALSSVTPSKQNKIKRSALHFLLNKKLYEKHPVRFDVIALSETNQNWIKGAF